MKNKLVQFIMISTLLALTSCDHNVKRYLGIERKAPDEYSIIKNQPLSVPPNFDLVPPGDKATKAKETLIKKNSDTELTQNDKTFLRKTQHHNTQNIYHKISK